MAGITFGPTEVGGLTDGSSSRYIYTDRDGVGIVDPAIRAYGSPYVGMQCVRAGAWWLGKAVVRFDNGDLAIVRARLLRKIKPESGATP
jgi:hypothetical protein